MATREEVYQAIDSERDYQKSKGDETDGHEHLHELESFVLYMDDYLTELKHQLSRIWVPTGELPTEALNTLRKVTTLGVAAMEQHGAPQRKGFER